MTQARHEYCARRGQESYDAETVDSVSSFFAASKAETLQAHDSASTRGRIRRSNIELRCCQKGWQAIAGP
jgi:hypothetical protein